MNTRYNYLNIEIQKVNNINLALNDEIDSTYSYIEDIETKEEAINALLDFLVIARTQANLLHLSVSKFEDYNMNFVLNTNKKPNEHINPCSDVAFKRRQIEFRY